MPQESRNRLFHENYEKLLRMNRRVVRHIRRMFPILENEDIESYAYVGMLDAMDRADASHSGYYNYINKYAYLAALEGATRMLGLTFKRGRKLTSEFCVRLFTQDPAELKDYIEPTQEVDWNEDLYFEDVINKIDRAWMTHTLAGTYEGVILTALLEGLSLPEISKCTGLKTRRIRKYVVRLCQIYLSAISNKPFEKYMTRVRHVNDAVGIKILRLSRQAYARVNNLIWRTRHESAAATYR